MCKNVVDSDRSALSTGGMDTCKNCRYFVSNFGGLIGTCRRNAPIAMVKTPGRFEEGFPETSEQAWCGQHQLRLGKGDNVTALMKESHELREGLVKVARLWKGNANVDLSKVTTGALVALIVDSVSYDQSRIAEWSGDAVNMPSEVTPPPPPPADARAFE